MQADMELWMEVRRRVLTNEVSKRAVLSSATVGFMQPFDVDQVSERCEYDGDGDSGWTHCDATLVLTITQFSHSPWH